ncbi:serine/threonine protein kinase, partial [Streptomyces lunaelactis]|uniref:serine/threonine-protein kinase n=1 Tax=Streptomyces lunaelactis TaxID=1535768 RepID=UPI0015849C01
MSGRAHDGTVFQPLGEEDPQHVAGYRLAARLGAGGMGKVYLSYTPGGRPIAIKVIRPDFAQDAEFRRRFAQEVQAAQRVQGLYTAPVIDADPEAKQPWLATAYVPGPSLADAVIQHGKLPVDTVLLLVAGIAEALHVIHGAGIVHRDLKPANVLLASDGPRVIDFGIARAADATSLTSSGVTIGTPSFMAPEQAAGSTVTAATDIFALGQIAAYASTGKAAFGEGTSHGVLYRIVHEEPDLTGLPDQLRELVTRCLTKDPEARPSVADLLAICQSANGETVLRRPEEWLPGAVAAEIPTRKAAPAPPVTPPAGQAPAPVQPPAPPPTQAATQAPVQPPGQQPPHYAPTQTAGQAQLQSPAPVTPPTAASAPA